MTRTALYRHFDVDGVLLYVGITCDFEGRDKQHQHRSKWREFVFSTTIQWCLSRQHALDLERVAIFHESPKFNVSHNNTPVPDEIGEVVGNITLLSRIDDAIMKAGITAADFGKMALKDPCLVYDLRNGRELRRSTMLKVVGALDTISSGAAQ